MRETEVEIDIYIHDCSLFWLGASIKKKKWWG
jgi:hypothetical protein